MTYFIDLRADNAGGNPVADVKDIVIRSDTQPTPSTPLDAGLIQAIQGRDVLLGTHGFHVNRATGIDSLNHWSQWLRLGDNGFFVGVLWPGDARRIPYLDYPIEGTEPIKSGQLLTQCLASNFTGGNSLSFASHSLGAQVVLETIRNLSGRVATVTIMAGAIGDTCLTGEYNDAANRINRISVLYSSRDDVLKWAFTVANPVAGIVTRGAPYWHGELGRYDPNPPDQPANLWKNPVLPDVWDFGHFSYINGNGAVGGQPAESGAFFPPSLVVPPQQTATPSPTPTPASVRNWQQAWVALCFDAVRLKCSTERNATTV